MNTNTLAIDGDVVLDLDLVSHAETKCQGGVLVMDLEMESTGMYLRVTGKLARKAFRLLFGAHALPPDEQRRAYEPRAVRRPERARDVHRSRRLVPA